MMITQAAKYRALPRAWDLEKTVRLTLVESRQEGRANAALDARERTDAPDTRSLGHNLEFVCGRDREETRGRERAGRLHFCDPDNTVLRRDYVEAPERMSLFHRQPMRKTVVHDARGGERLSGVGHPPPIFFFNPISIAPPPPPPLFFPPPLISKTHRGMRGARQELARGGSETADNQHERAGGGGGQRPRRAKSAGYVQRIREGAPPRRGRNVCGEVASAARHPFWILRYAGADHLWWSRDCMPTRDLGAMTIPGQPSCGFDGNFQPWSNDATEADA